MMSTGDTAVAVQGGEMELVFTVLDALRILIFVDVVLSWLVRDVHQFPRSLTHAVTRHLYAPFQQLLPPEKTGGLDLSPLFLLIAISLLRNAFR